TVDIGAFEWQPPTTQTTLQVSGNVATATVVAIAPGSNVPPGTVTFLVNGLPVGTVALVNGVATLTLPTGGGVVVAVYNGFTLGNYHFDPSQSAPVVVVGSSSLFATGADAGGGPEVKVFNADGSLRFDFLAFTPAFSGGVRVAVADVNGDGFPD